MGSEPFDPIAPASQRTEEGLRPVREASHGGEPGELRSRIAELEREITRLQEERRELEQQKYALDRHSIVAMTDPAGRILYANDKFCAISGYSREELLGMDHRLLNSGFHPREFWTGMYQALARGETWQAEVRNRAKNGRLYWVDTTVVPLLDAQGRPYRYIAIRTEITPRKEAEGALLDALQAAQASDRAKSVFLGTMSHELLTPLNGVVGFAGLLRDTPLNAEQAEYLQTIEVAGATLERLIRNLLDLSRLDAGSLQLQRVPYTISSTLDAAVETYATVARAKGLELQSQPDAEAENLVLQGDGARVTQVLRHLVENGIKFTRAGRVTLRVHRLPSGVTTGCPSLPQAVRVEVEDTGIGVSPEQQGHMFERFRQGDSSTTRAYGGAGMGLAICRRLIDLMGGTLGYSTTPGAGSTFWFTLPLQPPPPPPWPPSRRGNGCCSSWGPSMARGGSQPMAWP